MSAIRGYDDADKIRKQDHELNYKSRGHTAGKVFGYFFGTLIMVFGLFLLVAAMSVTIFHGLFLLILSIVVFVGGGLWLRWVHKK